MSASRQRKVLRSTTLAAYLVGALTLGQLVSEYVPLGHGGRPDARGTSSAAKMASKGLRAGAAQFWAPQSSSSVEPAVSEHLGAQFFSGFVVGSITAACVAFGLTMHGLGVRPAVSRVDAGILNARELFSTAKKIMVPDASNITSVDTAVVEAAKTASAVTSLAAVAAERTRKTKQTVHTAQTPQNLAKRMGDVKGAFNGIQSSNVDTDRMKRLTTQWRKEDAVRNLDLARAVKIEIKKKQFTLRDDIRSYLLRG
mmetsp:Transcript_56136/g.99966  ORF Transcript_56136/g.99966 Transcript_56136/m.99966 type:complete len:255 (-) Transcript_56136:100-864(-)|eukprot:CAMPEP_0197622532 /NCGR_PEP_ID=MMETSP1338-20131121/2802_1 /TAXON_ID=43686 ORGANISM="Pelagodinium beii, Strain RCC1491" /NCGR_SAMPLE_ID=MMETSP1338 /ASSEMBLY_ACC=CAM_ASM_000754 /LENGTH=254 /DNA_ID=CAMNT_0043192271 /DNA_START=34 /DNA_END=798 /DNA_ORIENTATION=-